MIPVKICGITRLEDGLLAAKLGAAALGFIFYPKSPRAIDPSSAKKIGAQLPKSVTRVGVFVNATAEEIRAVYLAAGLDMVQLSGTESPELVKELDLPVIKTIHVGDRFDGRALLPYAPNPVLLDSKTGDQFGGTGQAFDWHIVDHADRIQPVVLAGGLQPENVLAAVDIVRPDALDVNSGVETAPGIKSEAKLRELFGTLRNTRGTARHVFGQ
jgi:phosphoribosylanthranilate isomerase